MTAAANHDPAGTGDVVDLRTSTDVRAGALAWSSPDVVTGWHRHPYHQVEYALEGIAEVETAAGHFLLPPQQAIWIPAGLAHNTTLRGVSSVSVFFRPDMFPGAFDRARILAAAPVVREMMRYAVRWPITRSPVASGDEGDDGPDVFFEALARLVLEWLDEELALWLPVSVDPLVSAVMHHTDEHLATVTAASVCRAVGVSERTLRRRFEPAAGMTWKQYLHQARLVRAMALLAGTDRGVLAIAAEVGFESASGFTRAFRGLTGETPSGYRRRTSARRAA